MKNFWIFEIIKYQLMEKNNFCPMKTIEEKKNILPMKFQLMEKPDQIVGIIMAKNHHWVQWVIVNNKKHEIKKTLTDNGYLWGFLTEDCSDINKYYGAIVKINNNKLYIQPGDKIQF